MKASTVNHCVQFLLVIIVPMTLLGTQVAARDPNIVIAHPGQDVELLCTVTVTSENQSAAWLINGRGPHVVNSIHNGTVAGYTTILGSNNLIVENIMMNDDRNNSTLQCVIVTESDKTLQKLSDPYILYVAVATQKIPRIVIARPGQDVELLCTVTMTSGNPTVSWMINDMTPIGLVTLRDGSMAGYSSKGNNLIVENVTMNDGRNGSNYNCVITSRIAVLRQSNSTTLYVAGPPQVISDVISFNSSTNGNNVTVTLSWGEPFNNHDPIVNYTVSCSGDVTCPPDFTTTDNTIRSHIITNLTPMTNYTFSVVATNSIGSGEAGVVMITTPQVSPTVINAVTSPATDTATADTSDNDISMQPSGSTDMIDDETDNGVVVVIAVVIVILILCGCIIMDIVFCYCSKQKEQNVQDNGDGKHYNIVKCSIIVLGVSTLGTSILLWLLYKKLIKQCNGKDKYVEEANSVSLSSSKTKSSKNNGHKNEYDDLKWEDSSTQGSPAEVSYAATTEALGKDTQIVPASQYSYARTAPIKDAYLPDDGTRQPGLTETMPESYAVTDMTNVKDKKKDQKGKVDTKNQQPLKYAVVDKNKKKKKKDSKQLKNELSYMDPRNLEFKKSPHNHPQKSDEPVEYGNVVEGPKYTNVM